MTTLDQIAQQVRSKNAGPFWQTLDVFFDSQEDFEHVITSRAISEEAVATLYHVDAAQVRIFHLPNIPAVKVSFPRPAVAGSFEDRDIHAGQQHVPLAGIVIPDR